MNSNNFYIHKTFENIKSRIEYLLKKKYIYYNITNYFKHNKYTYLKIELDDEIYIHVKTLFKNDKYELDSILYPRNFQDKLNIW